MPTSAEPDVVFEANIVPGAYPAGEPFEKGEVKVHADGSFEIEIEGAQVNETYSVLVGEWVGTAEYGGVDWYRWSPDVTLITDEEGEGKCNGNLPSDTEPNDWSLFALNDQDNEENTAGANRYVSGFQSP